MQWSDMNILFSALAVFGPIQTCDLMLVGYLLKVNVDLSSRDKPINLDCDGPAGQAETHKKRGGNLFFWGLVGAPLLFILHLIGSNLV